MPAFLTQAQVIELRLSHKTTRDKKVADRIKAIMCLHNGYTYEQIAQVLMIDEVTTRRYVEKYQKQGLDGLLECRYNGGIGKLTLTQEAGLRNYLTYQTPQTAKAVVAHLKERYSVNYTIVGATKLLHRLGFVYKKPKVIPGKFDPVKQAEFITQYKNLKENLGKNDQIYFADATHPQHNTTLAYGWILKGKANDKYIKSNTGRKRLNLNGALNLKDKTAVVLEEKTIDANATINLLTAIKEKQGTGKVYIVLDNASYHHSKIVTQWLKRHKRFKTIFLPPYSPNLNLIERLWLFFHKKITYNRYFESFEEFKKTSLNFFKNLKYYQKELASLLTDSFQTLPI